MKISSRLVEFVLLFIGLPIVLIYSEDIFPLIPTILIIMGIVLVALRRTGWEYKELLILGSWRSWRNMLLVWFGSAVFWVGVVYLWQPESLFSFAIERPDIWLMVMVLYPLLSALPQEILYRTFIWHRYADLFNHNQWVLIGVSGFVFMWGHLMFMNWFALTITFLGGLTFAWRYYHTRSLLLVAVEHGLYGNLFFSVGLGQYLFSGAV